MTRAAATLVLADVMTRSVHVVAPFASMKTLALLISDNEVGALPVVDERGAVVGIVSEADLLAFVAGRSPHSLSETAADIMTSPAIVCSPDLGIHEAVRLFERHGVRHLSVVDAAGLLQGIVSRGDLLRAELGMKV
jgi:CBS domain-containing protein